MLVFTMNIKEISSYLMGTNVCLSNNYFVMKMSMCIMCDMCFIIDSKITVSDLVIPQPTFLEG